MLLFSFVNKIPAVRGTRQIRLFARMSQNCCKKKRSEFAVNARDSKQNKGRRKKKKKKEAVVKYKRTPSQARNRSG